MKQILGKKSTVVCRAEGASENVECFFVFTVNFSIDPLWNNCLVSSMKKKTPHLYVLSVTQSFLVLGNKIQVKQNFCLVQRDNKGTLKS